jgi:hypothetical protein
MLDLVMGFPLYWYEPAYQIRHFGTRIHGWCLFLVGYRFLDIGWVSVMVSTISKNGRFVGTIVGRLDDCWILSRVSHCIGTSWRTKSAILAQVFVGGAFVLSGIGSWRYRNSGLYDNGTMLGF